MSTEAELRTTLAVTQQTGIVFDPVYSGAHTPGSVTASDIRWTHCV